MRPRAAVMAVFGIALAALRADAQVIGTFSWQTQPYCNRLLVTVVQQGGTFLLAGTDDQCGGAIGPVTGTAVPSGNGVAMGLSIALATGRTAHLSATVSLATLSGTWTDADGQTGIFAFAGLAAGAPRPAPSASSAIQVTQFAPGVYRGTGTAATVARSDHDHDARYYTEAESNAAVAAAIAADNGVEKWMSISPSSVHLTEPADGAHQFSAGAASGLVLSDEVGAAFGFGLTLPPDYTPGTSLSVRLVFITFTGAACQFRFNPNTLTVSRVGVGVTNGTAGRMVGSVISSPGFELPFSVSTGVAIGDLNAQPGDTVNISFFRPTDTCATVAVLQGVRITYS